MKKSLLAIGKVLNKEAQKQINGGFSQDCPTLDFICDDSSCCYLFERFPTHCIPLFCQDPYMF